MYFATCILALASAFGPGGASFTGNRLLVSAVGSDSIVEFAAGDFARAITDAELDAPRGLAFGPEGMLYAASGSRVLRFSGNGTVDAVLGAGTGLVNARGLAIGPGGNLFVTSQDRVLELTRDGALVRTIGENDGLGVPTALCFGPDDHLFVAAAGSNEVVEYDAGFRRVRVLELPSLAIPMGLAAGPDGKLYVSSFFGNEVLVLDAGGEALEPLRDPTLLLPSGVTVGPNGHVFVASFFGASILEFDEEGVRVATIELPPGQSNPEGVVFAPFRFATSVKGRFAASGAAAQKIDETAVLSITPGSNRMLLDLGSGAMAAAFDTDAFVFFGFESATSPSAKTRHLQGTEICAVATGVSQGSLHVAVKGKLQSFGTDPAFRPKSGSGTMHRASPLGVFRGTVEITGPAP